MVADAGVALPALRVDGGMTANDLLLQIQADVLGLPVVRPSWPRRRRSAPPTRPGSPSASGARSDELRAHRARRAHLGAAHRPTRSAQRGYAAWNAAVERSLGWV